MATCFQFVPSLTARHGTEPYRQQTGNDAARILRRRYTSSVCRRDVGKCWRLDLFTRTNPLKTAR